MKGPREFPLVAVIATVALVGGGILLWRSRPSPKPSVATGEPETVSTATGGQASLYFPAASGLLEAEPRAVPVDLEPSQRKRWLAEQLVAGPQNENSTPALPAGSQVAGVLAAPDGTLYIDFTIPEGEGGGMGSTDELLALYSVINTMLLDDPASERAVLLINGRQRETLAGHVDTSRPLSARRDLINEPG